MSNFFLKLAFILLLLSIFEIGLTQTQTQTQTSTVGIDAQYSANIMDSQLHNSSTLSKNSTKSSNFEHADGSKAKSRTTALRHINKNLTEVNPTIDSSGLLPIKDSPFKEIILPGVINIPGVNAQTIDPTRGQIVEFVNGGSSSVYVSKNDINLIQIPFSHPLITSTDDLEIKQSDSNIYFQFKPGSSKPIQLFVENQSQSSTVLSLQLIPKSIASQVIKVVDNSGISRGLVRQSRSNDYISLIVNTMEMAVNNQNPSGFTNISLKNISPIVMNGLVVIPLIRMSSIDQEIYIYEARNPSSNTATLSEKEFDGETVLAISIFPSPILAKGENTKILVISKKQPFKSEYQ